VRAASVSSPADVVLATVRLLCQVVPGLAAQPAGDV
jgi:hypothetical protein